ncbi:MAG: hypothetical protein K6G38_06425 [Gammaproteobacteria bacterium]|jgi:hypothetical protein|nr:hypothetical protein [Gammaproteobacteria bacterium]
MREVYVKDSLAPLYNTLMETGIEVYTSQDGLTMDIELGSFTYRIKGYQTNEGFILVDSIERI